MIDEVLARKEENGLNGFKAIVLVECLYMHKGIRLAYFHGGKFLMYAKLERTRETYMLH